MTAYVIAYGAYSIGAILALGRYVNGTWWPHDHKENDQ